MFLYDLLGHGLCKSVLNTTIQHVRLRFASYFRLASLVIFPRKFFCLWSSVFSLKRYIFSFLCRVDILSVDWNDAITFETILQMLHTAIE